MTKAHSHTFVSFSLISILLVFLLVSTNNTHSLPQPSPDSSKTTLDISTTEALFTVFSQNNPSLSINNIEQAHQIQIPSIPADFKNIKDIDKKKKLFIHFMLPLIIEEQKYIRQKQELAQLMLSNTTELTEPNVIDWFKRITKEYKIKDTLSFAEKKKQLLNRLDELPTSLILAQAAIESGWGTSRFAIEGNSLFGEWTYNNKNSLTPKQRSEGKSHQIKAFPTLQASIHSYMRNINRNPAYRELRAMRMEMRHNNQQLDASRLATGLHRYSQKGEEYVKMVQALLNSSEFRTLQKLTL